MPSNDSIHPNLVVSPSKAHVYLFTKMRDQSTISKDFVLYAKRSMRILLEDALAEFPCTEVEITTPCAPHVKGLCPPAPEHICAVSIVRSGDALVETVRDIEPGVRVGKILIQRNEELPEKPAELFYSKLPKDIAQLHVLLCDPMLATGGSAVKAIQTLIDHGVDPANILFANMICAPEGLKVMAEKYPMVKIVTVCVDEFLNSEKYIVPGLGDYGDRYFNT